MVVNYQNPALKRHICPKINFHQVGSPLAVSFKIPLQFCKTKVKLTQSRRLKSYNLRRDY
jgi:hypothetical protein